MLFRSEMSPLAWLSWRCSSSKTSRMSTTIDLDVLSAAIAVGVSSQLPWAYRLSHMRAICVALAGTGRLSLVDVVELNPELDVGKPHGTSGSKVDA